MRKRRNPMPTKGALYVSNPRRRRNAGKAKKAKKGSPLARLLARWKSNPKKRKAKRNPKRGMTSLFGRKHNKRRMNRRRKNPVIQANPRHRKNSRRRKNPVTRMNPKNRTRKNPRHRKNPAITESIASMVNKVPVVGKYLGPYVIPGLFTVGGFALIHYALKYGKQYLPAQVNSMGYSIGGLVVATGLKLGGKYLPMKQSTTNALAMAAVLGGVAVDAFRYATKTSALGADDDMDGIAMGGLGIGALGDGGMWEVAPYGNMGDMGEMSGQYADACGMDAHYCGEDLDTSEGHAALAGPFQWSQRFPFTRQVTRVADASKPSRHAGKRGHRWGWLIKLVGFENFRKIVAMPPAARTQYVHALKMHAVSTIPGVSAPGSMPQMDTSDMSVDNASEGSTGGFGAMLYAGSGAGAAY